MASDPALVESVSSKGQEIELAVQNLEDEMNNSQQQLGVLEDSLANRWVACLLFDVCCLFCFYCVVEGVWKVAVACLCSHIFACALLLTPQL